MRSWKLFFLALAIAVGLSTAVRAQGVAPRCEHVPSVLAAADRYGEALVKEAHRFDGRDDPEAQAYRGVIYGMLDLLLELKASAQAWESENCKTH